MTICCCTRDDKCAPLLLSSLLVLLLFELEPLEPARMRSNWVSTGACTTSMHRRLHNFYALQHCVMGACIGQSGGSCQKVGCAAAGAQLCEMQCRVRLRRGCSPLLPPFPPPPPPPPRVVTGVPCPTLLPNAPPPPPYAPPPPRPACCSSRMPARQPPAHHHHMRCHACAQGQRLPSSRPWPHVLRCCQRGRADALSLAHLCLPASSTQGPHSQAPVSPEKSARRSLCSPPHPCNP